MGPLDSPARPVDLAGWGFTRMKVEIGNGNGGTGSSIAFIFVVGLFISPVWAVLVLGIAMWIMGLFAKHQIAQIPESSKMPFNVPAIPLPVEATLSDEEVDEKIERAKAEAARIAGLSRCSHEGRNRIFEAV